MVDNEEVKVEDSNGTEAQRHQQKMDKAVEYYRQLLDDPFDKREPSDKWRRACIVFRLPRNLKMPQGLRPRGEEVVERYATDRPGGLVW